MTDTSLLVSDSQWHVLPWNFWRWLVQPSYAPKTHKNKNRYTPQHPTSCLYSPLSTSTVSHHIFLRLLLLAAFFHEKCRAFTKGELDHKHLIRALSLFVICFPVLRNVEETEVRLRGNLFTTLYRNYTGIPPLWSNWPLGFLVGCNILTTHIYLWMQNW